MATQMRIMGSYKLSQSFFHLGLVMNQIVTEAKSPSLVFNFWAAQKAPSF